MQVFEKHGGGSHFMRPDRVYRTGVLSPWFNFAPGQDVQHVTASFTQRSMNLSGLAFAGAFGAAGRTGFMERMRLRFEAWRAKREAEKLAIQAQTPGPKQAEAQAKMAAAVAKAQAARTRAQAAEQPAQSAQAAQSQAAEHAQASSQGRAHGQPFSGGPTQPPFSERGQAFFHNPHARGMAYAQIGMQVAPHMMGQVSLLAKLTSGSLPHAVADAQVATTLQRWHNLRWNG